MKPHHTCIYANDRCRIGCSTGKESHKKHLSFIKYMNHFLFVDMCVYKGKAYSQGMKWRDGCDYNCECQDGMTGRYVCTEM